MVQGVVGRTVGALADGTVECLAEPFGRKRAGAARLGRAACGAGAGDVGNQIGHAATPVSPDMILRT